MSSVIVLDSSDEEEVPAKKPFIAPSIPATITPIKTTSTKCLTTNQLKHKKTKQRPIPSGITITRRSPVNVSNANNSNVNTPAATTNAMPANFNDTFVAATISAATLAATSKLNSMLSNKSGITTAGTTSKTNSIAKERQTPTPPRQQQQAQKTQQVHAIPPATKQQQAQQVSRQQQPQAQQVLPHLSQLPQLQPSPLVLSKRLTTSTTTQPMQQQQSTNVQKAKPQQNLPKLQSHQQQQHKQNARKLNTSPATLTPINVSANITTKTATSTMLPMIASVQSMAASATPPLQLLATPPHSAPSTFSDHQLFSPKSMHTTNSLPPSTTVTAARPQMASTANNNNTNSSSNKNINNSFKILLPPKSTNNTTPTSTPTPVALQQIGTGPRIAYVNSLAPQFQASTNNKTTNSNSTSKVKTPSTISLPMPIAITASAETMTSNTASKGAVSSSGLSSVRRVKPTTLLRKNDEAWLNRTPSNAEVPTIPASKNAYDDDLVLELLPHSSSSTTAKTAAEKTAAAEFVKNMASRMPILDADKDPAIMIIPNTLPTSTNNSYNTQKSSLRKTYPLKIDLTDSPEKVCTTRRASTPKTTSTPTSGIAPASVAKSKSIDRITNGGAKTTTSTESKPTPPPLSSDYEELLKVCREADTSSDMEKLVKSKLPKYYYNVHPDFVRSKGFSKSLRTVITNIQKEPDLVYLHLKTIVDELKVRSKSNDALPTVMLIKSEEQSDDVPNIEKVSGGSGVGTSRSIASNGGSGVGDSTNDDSGSTGNKHTDEQIKKLNKALYILTKRIEVLESAEVDWEDEDSSYLQVERFKKRACQIYEKICDLTGESKNAHRLVKKPIHFNGTTYKQFNKTLQAYVNRTKEFPDYFDVLRMLEHCNRQYDYALANFEMKRIAHDAFIKIGKLLQSRRKTDLYETVTHFTAHEKDPATIDPALQAKLSENQKKKTRISDVIEKYAREQDMIREELKEARQAKVAKQLKSDSSDDDDDVAKDDDNVASTSANAAKMVLKQTNKKQTKEEIEKPRKENNDVKAVVDVCGDDDDDDDDDEEDDEDEDEVNGSDLEADVEKLANGYLSDVDSTTEELFCEEQKEDNKTKGKTDSLSVVVDDTTEIVTTTKLKTDETLKTQNAAPTLEQSIEPSKMSMNDSSESRQTTRDQLAISTDDTKSAPTTAISCNDTVGSKSATAVAIANGCIKGDTQENINKSIKIVSVSSLQNKIIDGENEAVMNDEHQQESSRNDENQTQKTFSTTNTTTKESKQQRTVTEIVISDEES